MCYKIRDTDKKTEYLTGYESFILSTIKKTRIMIK
jgi:hypothetical protein